MPSRRESDFLKKIREDFAGGPSIVLRRKAVVDETFNPQPINRSKIVWIDASQLYP